MRHRFYGTILVCFFLAVTQTPGGAQAVQEIRCGKMLARDGAPPQLVMDDTLHVLDQTSGAAAFDPGAVPAGMTVKSIFCARSDIVPAASDYKVVAAGYPLTLFSRDARDRGQTRIAVLELSGGQLRIRSVGQIGFTPEMVRRIQTVLDASLPEFAKAASTR